MKANRPRAARLVLAVLAASMLGTAIPAVATRAATTPDTKELQELNTASYDATQSARVLSRTRVLLAQDLEPGYQMFLRQIMLRALVRAEAPVPEIIAASDTLRPLIGEDPRSVVQFNALMAKTMLERDGAAEQAYTFAQRALAATPSSADWANARAEVLTIVGATELERGHPAEAIARLMEALPVAADSHSVLISLGRAYERSGKADEAINSYIRALGTFPCKDTTSRASLDALFQKRYRSTNGLAERLEASCSASRKIVALDSRRHEMPAPDLSLRDFDGKAINFADLKGKVTVIDFWGSWCGPCRAELPFFQSTYERFRDKGVAFLGISWERASTREAAVKASRTFMEQNHLSFPAVVDHERTAVDAYRVDSFPTVFLIDKAGKVRYRNVGFTQDIEHILTAQLESLLQ